MFQRGFKGYKISPSNCLLEYIESQELMLFWEQKYYADSMCLSKYGDYEILPTIELKNIYILVQEKEIDQSRPRG